jgi:nitrogen fixation protein FixH
MTGRAWYWPAAIVALLVAGAGANIGLMVIATRDPSFAVEPEYYSKAVDWDRTMAQASRNAELGWRVFTRLEPASGGRARLRATIQDAGGAPITGAAVAVEAFPSARATQVVTVPLAAEGNGVYGASLPAGRPGLWELRLEVRRGDQRFTETVTQDLAARP